MNYADLIISINDDKKNEELINDYNTLKNMKIINAPNYYTIENIRKKYEKEITEIDSYKTEFLNKKNSRIEYKEINSDNIDFLMDYLVRILSYRLLKSKVNDELKLHMSTTTEKELYDIIILLRENK